MYLKHLMQILGLISMPVALSLQGVAAAGETTLKIGDTLPPFQANDQNGNLWRSKDHIGKENLVIYFFPAALTGG